MFRWASIPATNISVYAAIPFFICCVLLFWYEINKQMESKIEAELGQRRTALESEQLHASDARQRRKLRQWNRTAPVPIAGRPDDADGATLLVDRHEERLYRVAMRLRDRFAGFDLEVHTVQSPDR